MPGEVDVPWTAPSAEPVGAGAGWSEQAATTAPPPDLQWVAPEQGVEDAPQWAPVEEPVAEEIPRWSPPEQAAPAAPAPEPAPAPAPEPPAAAPVDAAPPAPPEAWEPPADEWVAAGEPVSPEDAQVTGEIPVVREPVAAAPAPEPVRESVEAEFAEPVEPLDFPPFAEEEMPPFGDFPPPPEEAVAPEPPDIPAWDDAAAEIPLAPVEPDAPVAPAARRAARSAAPAAAVVADAAPAPAAAPVVDDAARTGRFAIGGFAIQPGQQALGGVSFRSELAQAPTAWTVSDGDEVAPGTLVLQLDGTINCEAAGLEVVTEPGFAPTPLGFTVRVSALASGPFAASGTFRIR